MAESKKPKRRHVPVTEAAISLGTSPDALRKRISRGTARGLRRGGKVFVYSRWLEDEIAVRGGARLPAKGSPAETKRLARENATLSGQLDRMLNVQEREQVLRQQMQTILERMTARPQLPASEEALSRVKELEKRLEGTETEISALKNAVSDLVAVLERKKRER